MCRCRSNVENAVLRAEDEGIGGRSRHFGEVPSSIIYDRTNVHPRPSATTHTAAGQGPAAPHRLAWTPCCHCRSGADTNQRPSACHRGGAQPDATSRAPCVPPCQWQRNAKASSETLVGDGHRSRKAVRQPTMGASFYRGGIWHFGSAGERHTSPSLAPRRCHEYPPHRQIVSITAVTDLVS